MIFIFLQIIFLLLIVYLTSRWVLTVYSSLIFRFTKSKNAVSKALALFLLPGTFIHEIGHLISAELMLVRTDNLTLIPEIRADNSIKLGGVQIEKTDPLRRTIIGLAPVWFGLILVWVSTYWMQNQNLEWTYLLFYIYLLIQITLTMFSSAQDLEGSLIGLVLVTILLLGLQYLGTIIVFEPLVKARNSFFTFIEENLFYLRNGLGFGLLINISLTTLLAALQIVGRIIHKA